MTDSLISFAKRKSRRLAIILALISSVVACGTFIYFGYANNEKTIDGHIRANKLNLQYWYSVGDTFQLNRTIQNIVLNVPDILSIQLVEDTKGIVIAEASKQSSTLGIFTITDSDIFYPHVKNVYLNNNKGRIIVAMGFTLWPLFALLLIGPMLYFALLHLLQSTFIRFTNKLLNPIKVLSDQLQDKKTTDDFLTINCNTDPFREIQYFKESLLNLGYRIKLTEDKNKELIKDEMLVALAKQVAHDIRSPLTGLNVIADIEKENLSKSSYDLLSKSITRIRSIADDLLNATKKIRPHTISPLIEQNNHKVITAQCHPQKIAQLLRETYDSKLIEYKMRDNIKFNLNIDSSIDDAFIAVEKMSFERALSNLINNSVEAIPNNRKGFVSISLQADESEALLEIRDNGKGIPEDQIDKVSRGGFSFDKAAGNGLGLSSAKNIIESAGGSIKIYSRLMVGTTLQIRFPLLAC